MLIEEETIKFISEVIADRYGDLPSHYLRLLAIKAIRLDKVSDSEWLENEVSYLNRKMMIIQGIQDFHQFTKRSAHLFIDDFGEDCFEIMRELLADPGRIHPRWGAQFLLTLKEIGLEKVKEQDCAYTFVTSHPSWKKYKKTKRKYSTPENRQEGKQKQQQAGETPPPKGGKASYGST